jgi:predicted YcjX-like family ATPase
MLRDSVEGTGEALTRAFSDPSLRAGLGPPHIRLDAAAEFLLADRMG